jgi:hypothetical protein
MKHEAWFFYGTSSSEPSPEKSFCQLSVMRRTPQAVFHCVAQVFTSALLQVEGMGAWIDLGI